MREALGDIFAFDTRFWRTLRPLVTRPGALTVEYLEGRRQPYVPPLRAYVFASVLFFAFVAASGSRIARIEMGDVALSDQERFAALVNAAISYLHFFLVPLLALYLKALFRRPPRAAIGYLVMVQSA